MHAREVKTEYLENITMLGDTLYSRFVSMSDENRRLILALEKCAAFKLQPNSVQEIVNCAIRVDGVANEAS